MQGGVKEVLLRHPNGSIVVLIGTQHVSATHGCATKEAVERWGRPPTVVLEIDQERFQELNLRLAHLIHHDTAALLELAAQHSAAGSLGSQLLPDALLWQQHQQRFQTVRNEGVPLLLGSLYGSDMLQAALAATKTATAAAGTAQEQHPASSNSNHNSRSSNVVFADQPQELTMARFRALSSGLTLQQLGLWIASVLPGSVAHAEGVSSIPTAHSLQAHTSSSSSNDAPACTLATANQHHHHHHQQQQQQQQQQRWHSQPPLLFAAAQIAAGRLLHLCIQWWLMALSSQAAWYGLHVHPVFLLAGNTQLQQQLQDIGVQGVAAAAAAAGRMLQAAAAGTAPAAADVSAVRTFAASLEQMQRTSSGSGGESSSSREVHDALLLTQPWWVSLSEKVGGKFTPAGMNFSHQQQQQHVNHTAAMAYEQAVMADRNALLAEVLWSQAEAASSTTATLRTSDHGSSSSSRMVSKWHNAAAAMPAATGGDGVDDVMQPAVLGVVGMNHLPGIVQEWTLREQNWCNQQQQQQQQHDSSPHLGHRKQQYAALRLATTDAAADALEYCVVGSVGLAYLCAVSKVTQSNHYGAAAAAAAGMGVHGPLSSSTFKSFRTARSITHSTTGSSSSSSSSSSALHGGASFSGQQQQQFVRHVYTNLTARVIPSLHHLKRIGLLLLPVGVALLPLQRDAGRCQEASQLLHNVAVVSDEMTQRGQLGAGMKSMLRLAGVLAADSVAA